MACASEPPAHGELRVEFGQCAAVFAGPLCVPGADRHLQFWVPVTPVVIRAEPGAHRLTPLEAVPVSGGLRLRVALPASATLVEIRAGEKSFRLRLAAARDDPVADLAHRLANTEHPAEVLAALEAAAVHDTPQGADALSALARWQFRSGHHDPGIALLERALNAHIDAGNSLAATRDGAALAYHLVHRARAFDAAERTLDRVAALAPPSADARYLLAYFRGLVAFNSGDARRALPLLRAAAAQSARMGWESYRFHSEQMLALQLQMLGRRREALALLDTWQQRDLAVFSPCEQAQFANNRAWSALLLLEAGEPVSNPVETLLETRSVADAHCPEAEQVNVRINLALAQYHAGQFAAAGETLAGAHARTVTPEPRMRLWSLDLAARLALATGAPEAAAGHYADLQRLAAATLSPDAGWRASVGLARVLAGRGDAVAALGEYRRADRSLHDDLLRIPMHEGRESFLATRAFATREHVTLLLDNGHDEEAFELVRRERIRTLRGLRPDDRLAALDPATQQHWYAAVGEYRRLREELAQTVADMWVVPRDRLERLERTRDQQAQRLKAILDSAGSALGGLHDEVPLPAPGPGELVVAFMPLQETWAVFAHDSAQLQVHQIACDRELAGARLATCLLEPLAPEIAVSTRTRVLPHETLAGLDFHAARPGGRGILDQTAIVYGSDLPLAARGAGGRRALLLADPTGNLRGARREVQVIHELLAGTDDWTLQLVPGEQASPLFIYNALEQTDLFHFAGHARLGGTLGWDSALRFSAGAELAVTDILALERVPHFVVLSGCETGATRDPDDAVAGIGLAQAFLAAGAGEVLAATRPVRDTTATGLMVAFYASWSQGAPAAVALQRAQRTLRDTDPAADWPAFRLFVR